MPSMVSILSIQQTLKKVSFVLQVIHIVYEYHVQWIMWLAVCYPRHWLHHNRPCRWSQLCMTSPKDKDFQLDVKSSTEFFVDNSGLLTSVTWHDNLSLDPLHCQTQGCTLSDTGLSLSTLIYQQPGSAVESGNGLLGSTPLLIIISLPHYNNTIMATNSSSNCLSKESF